LEKAREMPYPRRNFSTGMNHPGVNLTPEVFSAILEREMVFRAVRSRLEVDRYPVCLLLYVNLSG
jgi:hypothetical protein